MAPGAQQQSYCCVAAIHQAPDTLLLHGFKLLLDGIMSRLHPLLGRFVHLLHSNSVLTKNESATPFCRFTAQRSSQL
jgi:hypothetical protein